MRGLSRRQWVAVAVVSAMLVVVAAAGAGVRGVGAVTPKIDTNATIKIGILSQQASIDPNAGSTGHVAYSVWDRLTTVDSKGNLIPMVATSWTSAKDGKSLTFKLRTDGTFHDGTRVNAAAVKASLDRVRGPGSSYVEALAGIESVDVVNASTVRVNLRFGGAELPATFATSAGAVINPKCIAANTPLVIPPAECSSGPMVVDQANPPTQWVLKKAPRKYWDPKAFRYQKLDVQLVPVTQTGINALVSGDLDMYWILADGLVQARALIKSGQFAGKPFASPGLQAVFLNPRIPPFNNPLLRRAVQAAFDPTGVSNGLFAGNCPPSQQPLVPSSWAYDRNWKPKVYDPALAKQLLTQAGVPDGFSFTVVSPNVSSSMGGALVMQDQLAKVDIRVQVRQIGSVADPIIALGQAQAFSSAWGPGLDPAQQARFLYSPQALRLSTAVGTSVEQSLQNSFFRATDPRLTLAQRGAVYKKIWKTVYDNALMVNVCLLGQVWLHNKALLNADQAPYVLYSAGIDPRYITKRAS